MQDYGSAKAGTVEPKQRVYFEQLVSDLDQQLKNYSDLKDRLCRIATSLRAEDPTPDNRKEQGITEMAPGYLSTLFSKVELLRKFNNDLEQTTIKLEQMF